MGIMLAASSLSYETKYNLVSENLALLVPVLSALRAELLPTETLEPKQFLAPVRFYVCFFQRCS